MPAYPGDGHAADDRPRRLGRGRRRRSAPWSPALALDVVFPVLHGPFGEDGTVQGLLELANVPYVGPGVMASAVGMDKATMKVLFEARGLPVTPWYAFVAADWARQPGRGRGTASLALGLPLFVKPANLGSSVGISKVKTADDAGAGHRARALRSTARWWSRPACRTPREIECAVLGNDDPEASMRRRDHPVARVLRLRGEVSRRGLEDRDPRGPHAGAAGRGAAAGDRGVQGHRRRRHVARGLPAVARHRGRCC